MKRRFYFFLFVFIFSMQPFFLKAVNDAYLFSPKGVAEIHITLDDGKKIGDIKRNEPAPAATIDKLKGSMVVKNSATSTYSISGLYNSHVEIIGHGNTSWGNPKRSYSIDLIDSNGGDNPAPLLGMPADEEWTLLAHWNDRSYMRNPMAYYLGGRMSGIAYSPRTRYIELYVNDEYRGVYSLVEKIKRSKDRVDISKLTTDAADQLLPRLSGGYLLESIPTGRVKLKEKNTEFKTTKRGVNFVFKYPKPQNATTKEVAWIKSYLDEFENVIYGDNYKDPVNGYLKYINEDNFIDWCILHELSKGVDNLFHCSVFVHKDRNGKLNMSAPWDFDISFGNHGSTCYTEDVLREKTTHWFSRLFLDTRFLRKYIERNDELEALFDEIPEILETNLIQLEESGCLDRDHEKYPAMLNNFKDAEEKTSPTTVRGHVRWLREWTESRRAWIYSNLGINQAERCERFKKIRPVVRVIEPENFEDGSPYRIRVMPGYRPRWDGYSGVNVYRITDNKEHTVQLFDVHGCSTLVATIKRGNDDTAIEQNRTNNQSINTFLVGKVLFTNYTSGKEPEMQVCVYNMQGRLLKKARYQSAPGFNQHETSLSELGSGMYVVKCIAGSEIVNSKIIISN
ncbi:CotH kinase family protein [Viscerimonas tarda]